MKIANRGKVFTLLAIIMVLVSFFLVTKIVNADVWSWTSGNPVIESNDEVRNDWNWQDGCRAMYDSVGISIPVLGAQTTRPTTSQCVLGETSAYKVISTVNDGSKGLAIQFNGDIAAHQIRGAACASCLYLPDKDMLVGIMLTNYFGSGPVVIYKDFVKKLKLKSTEGSIPNQQYYEVENPEPDEKLNDRYPADIISSYPKSIQRSSNGKWVIFESFGYGFFRLNIDTMELLKFSDYKTDYWSGAAPTIQMNMTDDGRHIAIFGQNTINTIYEIIPGCGTVVTGDIDSTAINNPSQVACPSLGVGGVTGNTQSDLLISHFRDAYQPKFSDDGGEISFYMTSYDDSVNPRHITLRASGYVVPASLDYLALGDSFSSGEGDIDPYGQNYYRANTDVEGNANMPQEKCHISTRSYPYLLAAGMGLSLNGPKQWNTIACSGAKTGDIGSRDSLAYTGQFGRLKGFNVNTLKVQALNEFIPGRQKQIEFVKTYKPKVITLTAGGNDVDFINKLKPCALSIGTCDYVNSTRADLASDIFNEYDNLKSLYSELIDASGGKAKIYVLSYPNFINDSASAACGVNVGGLNSAEREMISNSIIYLNNVIRQATITAGVKYIDIQNSLNGHRICDNDEKYVNAAVFRLGFATDWFTDYGSFHPNAKGHQAMVDSVLSERNLNHASLLNGSVCPDSNVIYCPDKNAVKQDIEVPAYFQNIAWRNTFYKQLTPFEQVVNGTVDVAVEAYTFASNIVVTVTGHSDPVDLGRYTVAANGSLYINFKLPASMGIGFHTINISGQSYSGDPIEFEQTILIKGSDPNDVDADGVLDNQDKCLFLSPVGQDVDKDGIDDACDPQIGKPPTTPSPTPSPSSTPKPTPTPSTTPAPSPSTSPKPQPKPIQIIPLVVSVIKNIIMALVKIFIGIVLKF